MPDTPRPKFQMSATGQRMRTLVPPYGLMGLHPYDTHAWTAQKLVTDLEKRSTAARQWLVDNNWVAMVKAFQEDYELAEGVYMPDDPNILHQVRMTIQEVAVQEMWEKHRVVFEIHPGLTKHLRTSDSDKFPPMVLQNLTHPNPFVFLAEPLTLKDTTGQETRVLGWFVVGMSSDSHYVDTQDDRARGFHLTVVSEVMSEDGSEVVDWDYTRITLPISGDDATVGELVVRALDRFNWDPLLKSEDAERKRYMTELLHIVIPHMLYLVSQNLETKPKPFTAPPLPKRNKWDRKQGGGRVARQLIGFASGPSLATLQRWGDEEVVPKGSRGSTGPQRPRAAHVRRAHFHTYWAGQGSKDLTPEQRELLMNLAPGERMGTVERRVKWLAPILVSADGTPVEQTKLVKVK